MILSSDEIELVGESHDKSALENVKQLLRSYIPGIDQLPSWNGRITVQDLPGSNLLQKLEAVLDREKISVVPKVRLAASIGKSSLEIMEAREDNLSLTVDAVLYPDYSDLDNLLPSLKKIGIRAVVRGGGTGVTGGFRRVSAKKRVLIDVSRLRNLEVDGYIARAGPGLRGGELERSLNAMGLTLGHFPESLLQSTVGGWISTRASGQESNQYGDIEDIVLGVTLYRSDFKVTDSASPRESSGITAKSLAIGGEGRTGLIGDAWLKVDRLPGRRYYSSFFFRSFRDGVKFLSARTGFPAVVRLSDRTETKFMLSASGNSISKKLLLSWMRIRKIREDSGSLMIVVSNDRHSWRAVHGAVRSGSTVARKWEKERFGRPDIGNGLWRMGLIPDTLETSSPWDRIVKIHESTISLFNGKCRELGIEGVIMAHISHLYRTGAAIYFTFMITSPADRGSHNLRIIRDAMVRGFLEHGGSVSHHHGVGTDFLPMLDGGKRSLLQLVEDPVLGDE